MMEPLQLEQLFIRYLVGLVMVDWLVHIFGTMVFLVETFYFFGEGLIWVYVVPEYHVVVVEFLHIVMDLFQFLNTHTYYILVTLIYQHNSVANIMFKHLTNSKTIIRFIIL